MLFTCYKIYSLKAYSSMAFSVVTVMHLSPQSILKHFHYPGKKLSSLILIPTPPQTHTHTHTQAQSL